MLSGVLLAAGSASRFGSSKLLHPWRGGVPIAVHAYRNLQAGMNHVIAVVREDDLKLTKYLRQEGASVIMCAHAQEGIAASIRCGISATPDSCGWIIALADMPSIKPATITTVAQKLSQGAKLVTPCHRGRRGHPVGISQLFYRELMQLQGDTGARVLLEKHAKAISRFECDDAGILYDIDTTEDITLNPDE